MVGDKKMCRNPLLESPSAPIPRTNGLSEQTFTSVTSIATVLRPNSEQKIIYFFKSRKLR